MQRFCDSVCAGGPLGTWDGTQGLLGNVDDAPPKREHDNIFPSCHRIINGRSRDPRRENRSRTHDTFFDQWHSQHRIQYLGTEQPFSQTYRVFLLTWPLAFFVSMTMMDYVSPIAKGRSRTFSADVESGFAILPSECS